MGGGILASDTVGTELEIAAATLDLLAMRIVQMRVEDLLSEGEWAIKALAHNAQILTEALVIDVVAGLPIGPGTGQYRSTMPKQAGTRSRIAQAVQNAILGPYISTLRESGASLTVARCLRPRFWPRRPTRANLCMVGEVGRVWWWGWREDEGSWRKAHSRPITNCWR